MWFSIFITHFVISPYSLLARNVNPEMLSTPKFYVRNVQYRSPAFRNCRMLTCICWAISIISIISINYHIHLYGQYFSNYLADLDNIGVVLGVIKDAESISDIFKFQNGRLNQKWPYFNSNGPILINCEPILKLFTCLIQWTCISMSLVWMLGCNIPSNFFSSAHVFFAAQHCVIYLCHCRCGCGRNNGQMERQTKHSFSCMDYRLNAIKLIK